MMILLPLIVQVIGACGGPAKCALVKEKGAVAAIDYNTESIKDRMKELTGGSGADIIFDAVGGKVFDECLRRSVAVNTFAFVL